MSTHDRDSDSGSILFYSSNYLFLATMLNKLFYTSNRFIEKMGEEAEVEKLHEEMRELTVALAGKNQKEIEEESIDVLICLVHIFNMLCLTPAQVLELAMDKADLRYNQLEVVENKYQMRIEDFIAAAELVTDDEGDEQE